jgi:predicted transcriptional regulator
VGIAAKNAILQSIRAGESWRKVKEIMTPELIYCTPFDTLAGLADMMERRNLSFVPVMYENKVVGLITPEAIWRYQASKRKDN